MSSSLQQSVRTETEPIPPVTRAPSIDTVEPAPAVAAEPPAGPASSKGDPVDRGFAGAILLGAGLGIIVFAIMMGGMTKILDPSLDNATIAAVAVWVGIWGGLFLGGTITVGLWSKKNFH